MRSKNHLNKEIRNIIEELLDKNYNFTKISKVIYKDRRTISREILPQGTSFDNLLQKDCEILMSHINSIPRDLLGGMTPYD